MSALQSSQHSYAYYRMNITISLMGIFQVIGFLSVSAIPFSMLVLFPYLLDNKFYTFNLVMWFLVEFILICLFYNPLNIHLHFVMGA